MPKRVAFRKRQDTIQASLPFGSRFKKETKPASSLVTPDTGGTPMEPNGELMGKWGIFFFKKASPGLTAAGLGSNTGAQGKGLKT